MISKCSGRRKDACASTLYTTDVTAANGAVNRGGSGRARKTKDLDMDLYVIRRPSAWANLSELQMAGGKSARIGNDEMSDRVRWIRSYVVHEPDGRLGTFCVYEARDGESIREH